MRPAFLLAMLGLVGCATSTTTTQPDTAGGSPPDGSETNPDPSHTSGGLRGELDPTFAQGPNDALAGMMPKAIDVDREGRIYVAGPTIKCTLGEDVYDAVVRLTPTGVLDSTFAKAGRLCMVDRYLGIETIKAASDGSLYIGGARSEHNFGFVFHYGPAGERDESFFGAVIYGTDEGAPYTVFTHLALGPDKSVFAIGQQGENGLVAKFGVNGAPVTKFGAAGIVLARDGSGQYSRPAIAGDKLFVTALDGGPSPSWELQSFDTTTGATQRHPRGPLPTVFGTGRLETEPGAPDLVIGTGGNFFVGGHALAATTPMTVVSLSSTFEPDMAFGAQGSFRSEALSMMSSHNLVATTNGGVIVAGTDKRGAGVVSLVGVTKEGRLDSTFGEGGTRALPAAMTSTTFDRIVEDPSTRAVVVLAREGAEPSYRTAPLLYRVH